MKRVVAILLTYFLAVFTVIAAEKPQKTIKLKNTPIVSTPITVVKPWEPMPFVQEGEFLPANYAGLDPKQFLAMFKLKVEGLKKGEFETSEEFAQRTINKDAVLTPINTTDLYAFRIDNIFIKYDADVQAYRIVGPSCPPPGGGSKEFSTFTVASVSLENDTYLGSNAYGASRPVERTRGVNFAIALPTSRLLSSRLFSQHDVLKDLFIYKDTIPVPLEKARNLKDMNVAVLFVGRVTAAKIVKRLGTYIEPKLDSPKDVSIMEEAVPFDLKKIVYYVIQTGEILGQKHF